MVISHNLFYLILYSIKGLQKARGPAQARPGPSPFLDGPGHGPQITPGSARRPATLKIYIYIKKYIQEIENVTLIKIFIVNYFIH